MSRPAVPSVWFRKVQSKNVVYLTSMPRASADPEAFISFKLPSPLERNSAQIAADDLRRGETASSNLNLILHDSSQPAASPARRHSTAHLTICDCTSVIWLIGCGTDGVARCKAEPLHRGDKLKHDPSMYSTAYVGSYGKVLLLFQRHRANTLVCGRYVYAAHTINVKY